MVIFSFGLVCFQYVFGIVFFTYLVRKYNLLGAGFFWLMHSIALVVSILGAVALEGKIQLLAIVTSVFILVMLIDSIKRSSLVKEPIDRFEEVLFTLPLCCVAIILFLSASDQIGDGNLYFEYSRLIVGGFMIGGVTTAMLVGHWYLVQPGLTRKPIEKLCEILLFVLTLNVILWLISPSMIDVFTGEVSDGWGGTLGYMWAGAVVTTFVLLIASRLALKEKSYTAVMATTGLLYLAVLMANGVELLPRTIFS